MVNIDLKTKPLPTGSGNNRTETRNRRILLVPIRLFGEGRSGDCWIFMRSRMLPYVGYFDYGTEKGRRPADSITLRVGEIEP